MEIRGKFYLLRSAHRFQFLNILRKICFLILFVIQDFANADFVESPLPTQNWLSSPGALSLLTYNIWGLYPIAGGRARWRYKEIGKRLAPFDIIAIQEAWDKKTDAVVRNSDFPFISYGRRAHHLVGGSGLITLSRYPILETEFLRYQNCVGFDCLADKGVLRTRILLPDHTQIDVYNTHLNAGVHIGLDLSDKVRERQLEQLSKWIESRSQDLTAIIMGDTNSPEDSVNYDQMKQSFQALDLYRLFHFSGPEYLGYTWDAQENAWIPQLPEWMMQPMRIDYIWLRGCKNPLLYDARVAFKENVKKGKPLSDHFAVHVEVGLNHCR